jgi:penicillin-binding protein 2
MAFAPADKPAIALALLVENGGFGSMAAAPIARVAFDQYLLGKAPTGPVPREQEEPPPAARVIAQAPNAAVASRGAQ